MSECFFKPCGEDQAGKPVTDAGFRRIQSIIKASKLREDNIHFNLEKELEANEKLNLSATGTKTLTQGFQPFQRSRHMLALCMCPL